MKEPQKEPIPEPEWENHQPEWWNELELKLDEELAKQEFLRGILPPPPDRLENN